MYITQGQGQTTPLGQMFSLTHLFGQLSPLAQVFPSNDFVTATQVDLAVKKGNVSPGHHL